MIGHTQAEAPPQPPPAPEAADEVNAGRPDATATPPSEDAVSSASPASGHTERGTTAEAAKPFSPTSGLVAVGLLIAAVMILGLIVLALRKRLFREERADEAGAGLLDDLREALREGRMTQQEFDAAKRAMVARITGGRTPEKEADRRS